MKKLFLIIAVVLLAAFVAWHFFPHKEEKSASEKKDEPLAISKKSSSFDLAFSRLMDDYYRLRDALVEWDTANANMAAKDLRAKAGILPFSDLKGDTSILLTAKSFADSLGAELRKFVSRDSIEQKRRSFNTITDDLYNIIRTVQYGGQTIYHMRCPMAFSDSEEGYWLSNANKIINPYLGKKHPVYRDKMVGCGEVVDSLYFTVK